MHTACRRSTSRRSHFCLTDRRPVADWCSCLDSLECLCHVLLSIELVIEAQHTLACKHVSMSKCSFRSRCMYTACAHPSFTHLPAQPWYMVCLHCRLRKCLIAHSTAVTMVKPGLLHACIKIPQDARWRHIGCHAACSQLAMKVSGPDGQVLASPTTNSTCLLR